MKIEYTKKLVFDIGTVWSDWIMELYTKDEWINLERLTNQLKDLINQREKLQDNQAYKEKIRIILDTIADYRIHKM